MLRNLIEFWLIYGFVFSSFLYVSSRDVLKHLVEYSAYSLLGGLFLYVTWNVTNFIWRSASVIVKEKISPKDKAVLITGCDSGFGHELAKRLDAFGLKVYAACLFPDGDGAQNLIKSTSSNLTVIKMNVTKDADVAAARQKVEETLGDHQLWAIVNNAGILASAEIEMGGMSCFNSQMEVNCLGLIRLTKAFLPLVRKAAGRVINVASLAGRFSIPGMVGYCVSKAAVISFSEGLRREMKKWNVDVITIEPHLFNTNLCNNEANYQMLLNAWSETPADIKSDYGECYFEGFQRFLNKVLGSARPRILHVVETMEIAVTDQFVGPSYLVLGNLERLRIWMWTLWPTRALDYLSHWAAVMQTGLPMARIRAIYEKKKSY